MAQRKLKRPTKLILDYDGTLTVKDTMSVLGSLPKQPKRTWQEIVDAYMQDYAMYKETPYPWINYGREEYSGWLAARKWVEQNSAQRVQDAAFFRGVTLDNVKQSVSKALDSGELELRRDWSELFALFLPHYSPTDGTFKDSSIEILSVNWSESAIRQALWQAVYREHNAKTQPGTLNYYMNDMKIFANEIQGLGSPYGSSGRLVRPLSADIRTSGDKLRYIEASTKSAGPKLFTVYVGDSPTDFDALCAADLGIWLCNIVEAEYEIAAKETFKPLNFVPPRLSSVLDLDHTEALFYWAPDFRSVIEVLSST